MLRFGVFDCVETMPILAYLANPLLLSRCDVEICILKLSTSMVSVAPCPGGCSRRPRWPVHLRFALMLSLARGVIVAYEVREPPRPHGRSRSHGSHMRLAFSTSSPAIWLSFCSGADPTGRSSRCCCNSRVGPRLRSVFACRGGDRRRRFERLDDIGSFHAPACGAKLHKQPRTHG